MLSFARSPPNVDHHIFIQPNDPTSPNELLTICGQVALIRPKATIYHFKRATLSQDMKALPSSETFDELLDSWLVITNEAKDRLRQERIELSMLHRCLLFD
jgi:hypothetical protein